MDNLLFVYGSLLGTNNEFAVYLNHNARFYATANFKGKLYHMGEYPGAIADPDGTTHIKGRIFSLNAPEKALIILDDYEGFGPDQAQPNLFVRKLMPVETANGLINCWIYLYNLPVDGLAQITSGDYLDYLAQKLSK